MKKAKSAHVSIELRDVHKAGSVEGALLAWAAESDTTAAGVIGSSFSTGGPRPGWSERYNADDFASRAFAAGALHYLDETDGRLKSKREADEDDEGAQPDIGGGYHTESGWSDESVVRVECPGFDAELLRETRGAADMTVSRVCGTILCTRTRSNCSGTTGSPIRFRRASTRGSVSRRSLRPTMGVR